MTEREKARAEFRARLKRLNLETAVLHVADLELGPFIFDLTRPQAERAAAQSLWFLDALDRAEIVAAFFGEPIPLKRRRALILEDVTADRAERLDEIFTAALKALDPKGNTP